MSKQYNLSTTEDNGQSVTTSQTVTEHPEEILRLMKLAGLENAQVVAEDEAVFEPTEANDKLDLDDYSKKSPESIAKQKKSIQPTLGDNPLEYSLDENEIYDAMMKEFPEEDFVESYSPGDEMERGMVSSCCGASIMHVQDGIGRCSNCYEMADAESEYELDEAQSPAQKAAFAKMLAAKDGKKDEAVEEKEETTVEENLEKAQEEIDELKEEELKEGCGCGHGSDCNCGPECDCGCNAVTEAVEEVVETEVAVADEDQSRLKDLINYQN